MDRRKFLILTGSVMVAGCESATDTSAPTGAGRVVAAGPAGNYTADGVYEGFRNQGFFIVRRGKKLFAIAAVCTHRNCKLVAEKNQSFRCPCHGSKFDPDGHVEEGPARRDLPQFATTVDENGQLLVTVH